MRVALVGPYPRGAAPARGGVESSFVNLVAGLARLDDVELHVFSFVPGLQHAELHSTNDVPIHHVPGPRTLRYLTRHASEIRTLRALLRGLGPDVLHAQDTLASGYACLRAAQAVPVVVSVHGIVREEVRHLPHGLTRMRMRLLAQATERYCIRRAHFLVSPTPYPGEYFGDEIQGQIFDVGNAVSDRFFRIEHRPEPGRILFAGAITPRKRFLDLVEALPNVRALVPEATLVVAGSEGETGYSERVRARIRELALEQHVLLRGPLSAEAMADEYSRAAVLALPSGQETSPMVIGEAMAASIPVVATDVGGVRHLVEDATTGHIVDVGDGVALADRLARVLTDPVEAARLGAAGRERACRSFQIEAVASRVRDVYAIALAAG